LLACLPDLAGEGIQLALLGSGDADLQTRFQQAAEANPGRIGVVIGYDERLAHLIQAGSDALVVPSRFEPCGLTQLCALRYGAVPIVAGVGGLEDTVIDGGSAPTGFKFNPVTTDNLAATVRRARAAFADKSVWRGMQTNGMATDVSWRGRAARYAELYREIAEMRRVLM
jgi:starch synthase